MPTNRRPAGRGIAIMVGLAIAAACSADRAGDDIVIPEVVYDGEGPNRAFQDDPWVRAVERAEIVRAAAINSANFSGAELLELWGAADARDLASASRARLMRSSVTLYLGPHPFEALGVVTAPDGTSAKVIGCTANAEIVYESPGAPHAPRVVPYTYHLELLPDGTRQIVGVGVGEPVEPEYLPDGRLMTDELCATVDVPKGRFDPEPDLESLVAKDRDDVVFPPEPSPSAAATS